MKYKVRGTDLSFFPEIEVEADNKEKAREIYHWKWENGELEAEDSELEITVESIDKVKDNRKLGHKSEEWCGECGHVFDTKDVVNTCPECNCQVIACNACVNHGAMCCLCEDASNFRPSKGIGKE